MESPASNPNDKRLFPEQRQEKIAKLAHEAGRLDVNELAIQFDVTTETIRRDLSELQQRRLVRRVHGGAIPWEKSEFEPLLTVRDKKQSNEKQRIGAIAIRELPLEGSIIIDSGSTLNALAKAIPSDYKLRVTTNSLATARTLVDHAGIKVVVIGGSLHKNTLAMVDAQAVRDVEQLNVDTLFISCDGLTAKGLNTPYRSEAALKQAMVRAANRTVVLADHSKFGQTHTMRFATWSDIDILITDSNADPELITHIEAQGPTVLLA